MTPAGEARGFLEALHGHAATGWLNLWTLEGKQSFWFQPGQMAAAADRAMTLAGDRNVYVAVGVRREVIANGRGRSADVIAIPGIWADVDVRGPAHTSEAYPETFEAAEAFLRADPFTPSLIVHSGHGLQPYWLFDEPWIFADDGERQSAQDLLRRAHAYMQARAKVRGWTLDNTSDLARVLRVPGTVNRKIPDEPVAVRLLQRDGPLYTRAEIESLLPLAPTLPVPTARPTPRPVDLSDADRFAKTCRSAHGPRFLALWNGDTSGHGSDDNRADLALCNYLRFEWGRDADAIDRMFRQSGLMRPKWDEPRPGGTYGSNTIALATAGGDVYDPDRQRTRAASPPPSPPVAAEPNATEPEPQFYRCTDMGNAQRLVARFGADLRFTLAHGWLIWRQTHWQEDRTQAIMRRAKTAVRAIYLEAARADDEAISKAIGAWAYKSQGAGLLRAMVRLAESEPNISLLPEAFDAQPDLLNCENGTHDLLNAEFREHRREDLITKVIPIAYDAGARCPRWEQFIAEVTRGDADLAAYLQRAVGYSLTGDVSEQNLFFLYGLGANGKTTFLNVLRRLLGEYATMAAPGLLLEMKHEQHPTGIADLAGRRAVICSEVGEGKRLAEELVKKMTGAESQKGRKMRQDFFEFEPLYKLWLAANHKPIVKGTDDGIWRRIHTVPFTATFYDPAEAPAGAPLKDTTLIETLCSELPGILAWAVRGCQEWRRIGLARPEAVLNATQGYREEMDILGGFLTDRCIQQPSAHASAGALYAAYQSWCVASGEQAVTQKALGMALKERGFVQGSRWGIGRIWEGIGILDETTEREGRLGDS